MAYHHGKLTEEAKTMVTEDMDLHIKTLAKKAGCQPSELIREAIYLFFSGETFTGHVANDRRSVMQLQGVNQGDKGACK
jgi:hypothetical protein